jgi:DNA-binding transcriptional ArsR family regulator/uncharacterized protein YndB with AHSA1/START domain
MQPDGCMIAFAKAASLVMDEVFRALADPGRRRLLDSLNERGGQTLGELCGQLDMARQSVSKHLAVLEQANLVTIVWRGREKLHYLNAEPINAIAERWIDQFSRERVRALADLKRALEGTTMERPEFAYTTYIRTTPERLWQAITDPVFSRRYMGHAMESSWEPGAPYVWTEDWGKAAHPDQVILESLPYSRLAFAFFTLPSELREPTGLDPAAFERAAAEPRTRVTFDIEPYGDDQVKLTVIHDGFEPGSVVFPLIADGWPVKLAGLKTGLEQPARAS